MWDFAEIILLIAAPLAWGLLVEYVFERFRRRRGAGGGRDEGG